MDSIAKKHPITSKGSFGTQPGYLMGKTKRKFYRKIMALLNDDANHHSPLATREFASRLKSFEYFYQIRYQLPTAEQPLYELVKNDFEVVSTRIV